MAINRRPSLFSWRSVESRSDLDRLRLVLETLPDEELMKRLEAKRGRGRNDYPVRAIWNSLIAGIVFQHESIESLRRELSRNGELRDVCDFDPLGGGEAVPSSDAYSRFLKNLAEELDRIEQIFDELLVQLKELLPDLGHHLAVDGKQLPTYARGREDPEQTSDPEADWGWRAYRGVSPQGQAWEKLMKWFGYKLHLIVDSVYELPLCWEVTRGSVTDTTQLLPLFEKWRRKHPAIVREARDCAADKGYDSVRNVEGLWGQYAIKPVIDIRLMQRSEEEFLVDESRADNITYDQRGQVCCYCPKTGEQREMAYQGFEAQREQLKYRCPAAAYGFECLGRRECGTGRYGDYGRSVRIALERDPRILTPLARSSYAWQRAYNRRTAIERVYARLDVNFGFERHYIRGHKKMQLRVGLALMIMLALAVGHVRAGEQEKMRSLVKRPAA